MPKTAVGLFEDKRFADAAVGEIETLGLPRSEIRVLGEPLDFAVPGVMSIPRVEFEVDLTRELVRIGATRPEADFYVGGVRHGDVLVFATSIDDKADAAAQIMSRHDAVKFEEVSGLEPNLPGIVRENMIPENESSYQAGRFRSSAGANAFVW